MIKRLVAAANALLVTRDSKKRITTLPSYRYVVSAIVKEMARTKPIETQSGPGFKVIVLHEVSRLSKLAQQSLRRTMEKYSKSCRIVLCCDNVSRSS